jgi:hypothetical protein
MSQCVIKELKSNRDQVSPARTEYAAAAALCLMLGKLFSTTHYPDFQRAMGANWIIIARTVSQFAPVAEATAFLTW